MNQVAQFLMNVARTPFRDVLARAMGGGEVSSKHKFECDYGWPERLVFRDYYKLYTRYSLAAAAVDKTIAKTWQTMPAFWEGEEPASSNAEKEIADHFIKAGIWKGLMEADRRGMVGHFGAAIIILRDGKDLREPVDRVARGIRNVAGIIPAWEGQLLPLEWDSDPYSETYGQPIVFTFDQTAVGNNLDIPKANIQIHRDRVLIFSSDGTVNGRSALEAGFNDVSDAAKIKGAGAEGFWKTSRGAPIITAQPDMSIEDLKRSMGAATNAAVIDKINEQVQSLNDGFDSALMLGGGMQMQPLTITLPQPKEFWETAVQSFAASMNIPVKELIGNVTGERASTEDAKGWNETNMSRRDNRVKPALIDFIDRLERWGVVDQRNWVIGWQSLLEASPTEKMDRALKMSEINAKGEPIFLPDEIRIEGGFAPGNEVEGYQEMIDDIEEVNPKDSEEPINE